MIRIERSAGRWSRHASRFAHASLVRGARALGDPLVALRLHAGLDLQLTLNSPSGHFYIVSTISVITVGIAVVVAAIALRADNIRALLLTLSFVSMAAIFSVHGLSTPGFIVDERFYGVTGTTSQLALLVSSAFLAASAIAWPANVSAIFHDRAAMILGGWSAILLVFALLALSRPDLVPPAFSARGEFQWGATALIVAFAAFAATRYGSGFRHSGLPMYGAVALGALLLGEAQITLRLGAVWSGIFWLYHVQLLFGIGSIVARVLLEYGRGRSPLRAIEQLMVSDPLAQIRAGKSGPILGLAAALEARDGYTIGHGERVAELSAMMGRELALSPRRLRVLWQGAMLHDVGKIGVPDALLHKPGALTDEEFDVIREHPVRGDQLMAAASDGSGNTVERAVIRHHHERWDGGGYPDGLAGEAIPFEARIVAVADVYDALRSMRSYRDAWSADRAQQTIIEGANAHFDARCVVAFEAVVAAWEAQVRPDDLVYEERRSAA